MSGTSRNWIRDSLQHKRSMMQGKVSRRFLYDRSNHKRSGEQSTCPGRRDGICRGEYHEQCYGESNELTTGRNVLETHQSPNSENRTQCALQYRQDLGSDILRYTIETAARRRLGPREYSRRLLCSSVQAQTISLEARCYWTGVMGTPSWHDDSLRSMENGGAVVSRTDEWEALRTRSQAPIISVFGLMQEQANSGIQTKKT